MKNQYFLCLIALILTGCIGAADFGMKEDVYQRTLASIENQSIPISINHVYWKGSPENIGEKKAVFSNQNPILVQVLKDTIGLSGVKLGEPLKVKASLNAFFPELLKELQAFAKYSEFSEDQVLSFAGSHFAIGGCSILARSGQTPLLARNYDWTPRLVDGILARHESTSQRIGSLSISASIFGALSGINEKGLAIAGINSQKRYYTRGGLSMPIIVRGVLEKAIDVESAVSLLKKTPHTTPINYVIADQSGQIAVVEVTPHSIKVRRDHAHQGFLAATNHFQELSNEAEKVKVMPNSERRLKQIEVFLKDNADPSIEKILSFLGDTRSGPAMENYSVKLGTLWSIVYLPQKGEMIIRAGLEGDQVTFGFNQNNPEQVKGVISDKPAKFTDYF